VSAAVKKLDGVESVEVSLEKGFVDIRLKSENTVTLPELRRIIRSNGNETKDAQVAGRGRIVDQDRKPVLDLLNGATMELETRPDRAPAGVLEIMGTSREQARNVERLMITSIK
jgi:copper chaperone CopZ